MRKHPMPNVLWRLLNHNNRLTGGIPTVSLPMGVLSDFNAHYALFDDTGMVREKARTFRQAMHLKNKTGLHMTRILD